MVHDDVSSSDQATVDAVGKATEALEYVERARGHLYAFHQLIGRADVLFEESAVRLGGAGHRDETAPLWRSLVGRDVLEAAGPSRSSSGSTTTTTTLPVPRLHTSSRRASEAAAMPTKEELRMRRRAQRAAFLAAEAGGS